MLEKAVDKLGNVLLVCIFIFVVVMVGWVAMDSVNRTPAPEKVEAKVEKSKEPTYKEKVLTQLEDIEKQLEKIAEAGKVKRKTP